MKCGGVCFLRPWAGVGSHENYTSTSYFRDVGRRKVTQWDTGLGLLVEMHNCRAKCSSQENHTPTHIKGSEKFFCNLAASHTGFLNLHSAVSNAGFKGSPESYSKPVIIKIFKATERIYSCVDTCVDLLCPVV